MLDVWEEDRKADEDSSSSETPLLQRMLNGILPQS